MIAPSVHGPATAPDGGTEPAIPAVRCRDERWGHRVAVLTGCALVVAAAVVAVTS